MTAIVSIETVLLVLLVVLVAALLRSHAEILRRLGPFGFDGSMPPPTAPARAKDAHAAPSVSGTTPDGDAVSLAFGLDDSAPTLLAFLSTGCTTCEGFWEALGARRLAPEVQTVIVTRGPDREQPAKLRKLAPDGVPVVMSSPGWDAYEVPGSPYFVLVDGTIRGEGVATTWEALSSLVLDAIEDQRAGSQQGSVDETFAAAEIGPDHPSLYPAGRESE